MSDLKKSEGVRYFEWSFTPYRFQTPLHFYLPPTTSVDPYNFPKMLTTYHFRRPLYHFPKMMNLLQLLMTPYNFYFDPLPLLFTPIFIDLSKPLSKPKYTIPILVECFIGPPCTVLCELLDRHQNIYHLKIGWEGKDFVMFKN